MWRSTPHTRITINMLIHTHATFSSDACATSSTASSQRPFFLRPVQWPKRFPNTHEPNFGSILPATAITSIDQTLPLHLSISKSQSQSHASFLDHTSGKQDPPSIIIPFFLSFPFFHVHALPIFTESVKGYPHPYQDALQGILDFGSNKAFDDMIKTNFNVNIR